MRTQGWILLVLSLALFLTNVNALSASGVASSASACPGDVNDDGAINVLDLVAVAVRYGDQAIPHAPEDANGDGYINLLDLVLVTANYGCGALGAADIGAPPAAATETPPRTQTARPGAESGYVTRVIDGDTVEVQMNGSVYPVRYIGIDAPELPHECYARETTNKSIELVLHQTVMLEKDVRETDYYGRLLRYVYVGDSFVNAELVRLGYAQVHSVPPDVRYASYFLQLQQEARDAGRGLWAGCPTPTLPQPPPPPTEGTVMIRYVFYDGVVPQVESDEFAEIFNKGDYPVNLAGWRLNASSPEQDFYFPDFLLQPGQACRVYTNEYHPGNCGFNFRSGHAVWNNKGDCGYLYDASGTLVSMYCYW
jgi:endonuclease YncB( thermonuclease family)